MTTTTTATDRRSTPSAAPPTGRFLARAECEALAARAATFARGGGETWLHVTSSWTGNIRWARNEIISCGDVRDNAIYVRRLIRGAQWGVMTNQTDDAALEATVRRAERLVIGAAEQPEERFVKPSIEPFSEPHVWSDRTFALDMEARAEAARVLTAPAKKAGMIAAGYIEVSAYGQSIVSVSEHSMYHPYTAAQYSVTVRDPNGAGSGWAGMDHWDWGKIDAATLSEIALDKCLRSRNPSRLEPGRYTTVLEPQAVCDIVSVLISPQVLDRQMAENWPPRTPFSGARPGDSKIGQRVVDERITIGADPADPDMAFLPVDVWGTVYHAVDWIKDGVLSELAYFRPYGIQQLGKNTGLPTNGAFRMSGGTSTVEEMIANTKRGLLVTRLSNVQVLNDDSLLCAGYTRDGLWLIEDGKISRQVKNFKFTDSPLFVLNTVEMLGVPKRVYHPFAPAVVPALKVREMSFTALSDAI